MDLELFAALERECGVTFQITDGSALTTIKIGGQLSHLVSVQSEAQLTSVARFCRLHSLPIRMLGAGSNLIIPTSGLSEIVIVLGREFSYVKEQTVGSFEVGGATMLPGLSLKLSQEGLSGLEFAAGIPGTVGGGVRINCGAHQADISQILNCVRYLSFEDNTVHELNRSEIEAGYRQINVPLNSAIVSAKIRLTVSDKQRTLAERQRCLSYRKATQPLSLPSAGSVFRNPTSVTAEASGKLLAAGAYIENAGLKGEKIGGAEISRLHGNWIVNPARSATSDDVRALVDLCQAKVALEFGVKLKPEVVFW